MTAIRPRRSVLYMPGSNARALEKAKTLPADALILDLEDAVAPDAKDGGARAGLRRRDGRAATAPRELVIRINALDTPWGEADLAAAAAAGPDAILIPKVSYAGGPGGGRHAPAPARRAGAHPGLGHDRDAARASCAPRRSPARPATSTRGSTAS